MANPTVAKALDRVERRALKCAGPGTTETFVLAGRLVEKAIQRAYDTRESAAGDYGVTQSLMSRQITNQDNQHLSFQRMWSLSDEFWLELIVIIAEVRGIAAVRRQIVMEMERSA
jgi:hypothetical protein